LQKNLAESHGGMEDKMTLQPGKREAGVSKGKARAFSRNCKNETGSILKGLHQRTIWKGVSNPIKTGNWTAGAVKAGG